jgi:hypothetical protein
MILWVEILPSRLRGGDGYRYIVEMAGSGTSGHGKCY